MENNAAGKWPKALSYPESFSASPRLQKAMSYDIEACTPGHVHQLSLKQDISLKEAIKTDKNIYIFLVSFKSAGILINQPGYNGWPRIGVGQVGICI